MDFDISGRRVLITGGSRGIGLATAHALAGEGCDIALCGRSQERLDAACRDLARHQVEVLTLPCDAQSGADIEGVVERISEQWAGVDILINNVGGNLLAVAPLESTDPQFWRAIYDVNALATIRFTNALLPAMRRRKWGRVVTVTARLGRESGGGTAWYNMAKTAQTSLMKSLAQMPDLVRDGITFNSIAPGATLTADGDWAARLLNDPEGFARRVDVKCPLGRLGTPEEVANVIAFLCSVQASLINGAAISVDGAESRAF